MLYKHTLAGMENYYRRIPNGELRNGKPKKLTKIMQAASGRIKVELQSHTDSL